MQTNVQRIEKTHCALYTMRSNNSGNTASIEKRREKNLNDYDDWRCSRKYVMQTMYSKDYNEKHLNMWKYENRFLNMITSKISILCLPPYQVLWVRTYLIVF